MLWHEHLKPLPASKDSINSLLVLTQLLMSTCGIAWLSSPLRQATIASLHDIARIAGHSHIGVQCLLHKCPRLLQHGSYWQLLMNEQLIAMHAVTLHTWVHAILITFEPNPPSCYKFHLTNGNVLRDRALRVALQATNWDSTVLPLHQSV